VSFVAVPPVKLSKEVKVPFAALKICWEDWAELPNVSILVVSVLGEMLYTAFNI
jgi:hypothetical protein